VTISVKARYELVNESSMDDTKLFYV